MTTGEAGPELLGPKDFLAVIIGPSGVGKSTVARLLLEKEIVDTTPSWTDRPPLRGEEESTDYDHRFVTPEEFRAQRQGNGFVVERNLYGHNYGLPHPLRSTRIPLVLLKPSVIPAIHEQFPLSRIYQVEAPIDVAAQRMRERGDSEAEIAKRLEAYEAEVAAGQQVADKIFTNTHDITSLVVRVAVTMTQDQHFSLRSSPQG